MPRERRKSQIWSALKNEERKRSLWQKSVPMSSLSSPWNRT